MCMIRNGTHIYIRVCAHAWISINVIIDRLLVSLRVFCLYSSFRFRSLISFMFFFSPSHKPVYLGICSIFFRKEWFTRSSGSPIVIHYSDFKELGNKQKWVYCIVVYHRVELARLGWAGWGYDRLVILGWVVILVENECQHFLSDFIYFGSRPMCHFVAIMAWKVILWVEYLMKKYDCLTFFVFSKPKISVQEIPHLLELCLPKKV